MPPNLILASGSPRRKQLLGEMGFVFSVIPSEAEELHDDSMQLRDLVEENAYIKANDIAQYHLDSVVIGSDTLVYIDQTPLGKPKTEDEAKMTLRKLSGRAHQVCTGLCIISSDKIQRFSVVTDIVFKTLSDEEIDAYMRKVDVMDKAGSYAIQEHGEMIIQSIKGDYSNVVGLPQERLRQELLAFGIEPQ